MFKNINAPSSNTFFIIIFTLLAVFLAATAFNRILCSETWINSQAKQDGMFYGEKGGGKMGTTPCDDFNNNQTKK